MSSTAKQISLAERIAQEFTRAPIVIRYQTGTSSWPARPSTSRVVLWLALSESVPDPSGLQPYDLVLKGSP